MAHPTPERHGPHLPRDPFPPRRGPRRAFAPRTVVILGAFLLSLIAGFVLSRSLRRGPGSPAPAPMPARASSAPRPGPARSTDPSPSEPGSRLPPPVPGGRRGLTPSELQRAVFAEMLRAVRVRSDGRASVPGHFVAHLHPEDVRLVETHRRWFLPGLAQALERTAADQRWRITGAIDVRTAPDAASRPGLTRVDAPTARAGSVGPHLIRLDSGGLHPLTGHSHTIGRATDVEVPVDDGRVSRRHARIDRVGTGWVLTDLESANGTTANGHPVPADRPVRVPEGAIVGVGPIDFEFHDGSARSDDPGRPLSDGQRVDLARRAFPPTKEIR